MNDPEPEKEEENKKIGGNEKIEYIETIPQTPISALRNL